MHHPVEIINDECMVLPASEDQNELTADLLTNPLIDPGGGIALDHRRSAIKIEIQLNDLTLRAVSLIKCPHTVHVGTYLEKRRLGRDP